MGSAGLRLRTVADGTRHTAKRCTTGLRTLLFFWSIGVDLGGKARIGNAWLCCHTAHPQKPYDVKGFAVKTAAQLDAAIVVLEQRLNVRRRNLELDGTAILKRTLRYVTVPTVLAGAMSVATVFIWVRQRLRR